jgi:hypothetical protein
MFLIRFTISIFATSLFGLALSLGSAQSDSQSEQTILITR